MVGWPYGHKWPFWPYLAIYDHLAISQCATNSGKWGIPEMEMEMEMFQPNFPHEGRDLFIPTHNLNILVSHSFLGLVCYIVCDI